MGSDPDSPMAGRRVAVTLEHPGRLSSLLLEAGAEVVHVPLIKIVVTDEERTALTEALTDLTLVDWVLVTSAAGAEQVAPLLTAGLARATVRVGAVGVATAERFEELIGAKADLVPDRQLAVGLADRFVELHEGRTSQRVVIAQADRATGVLGDRLRDAGHQVLEVTAYRTLLKQPSPTELAALTSVDAVVFASGSAARSWSLALGEKASTTLPGVVVAIGPSTAAVAEREGLKITVTCVDHTMVGVVEELKSVWRPL